MTNPGSPGTDGRHTQPQPHRFTPAPVDAGERQRCKHCGQPRHEERAK